MRILKKTDILFWFTLTVFLSGCFFRYYVIWVWDLSDSLPVYLADDMFYYLKIAKNISLGHGVTFDGINKTNGFHPLYMCFLVLFYRMIPFFDKWAIEFASTFLALTQIATAVVLWGIAKKLFTDKFAHLVCIATFLLHPFNLFTGLSGVEAPLAVLFLALSFLLYLSIRNEQTIPFKRLVALGILFGLSCLSRTDSVFFIAGIILDFIGYRIIYKRYFPRTELFYLSIIFIFSFFLLSVWFIWSYVNFGTIRQDSMRGILFWKNKWHAGKIVFDGTAVIEPRLSKIYFMAKRILLTFFQWPLSAFIFFIYVLASISLSKNKKGANYYPLLFVSLTLVCLWFFYIFYLNHEQKWYYLSSVPVFALWCGVIVESLIAGVQFSRLKKLFKLITGLLIFLYLYLYGYDVLYPWQVEQGKMAMILKNYVSQNEKVGSFNAGIYGYFSGMRVVNLDGVTNHSVLPYLEAGRLYDYLKKNNIQYIVDYKAFFEACKPFGAKKIMGIETVDVGEIILFKIEL